MKRTKTLIPEIRTKINNFLKQKELTLQSNTIEQIFLDDTRHCFFAPVLKNKQLYFLKIRTHQEDRELSRFAKQYALGMFLKQNYSLIIAKYTPKLIEGSFNRKDQLDYLLYEYIENTNTGSRSEYGICNLTETDLEHIVKIIIGFLAVSINRLPKNLPKQQSSFYREKMIYHHLESQYQDLIKQINWPKFDQNNQFFSHGDFGPHNFGHTKNGLIYSDFDDASITNPYFDVATLWVYAFLHQEWRQELIKRFKQNIKGQFVFDQEYLFINMLVYTLVQIGFLLRHPKEIVDLYLKRRHQDLNMLASQLGIKVNLFK